MNMIRSATAATRLALSVAVAIFALASAAQATTYRTFVSGVGDDTNPCTQAQPCRTFAAAYALTLPGGEIHALDDGNYTSSGLVITGPITIIGEHGAATVHVFAGMTGITVNAGPNDLVVLRNLNVTGLGVANTRGILAQSGRLVLKNSTLSQLTVGISVEGTKADLIDVDVFGNTFGVKTVGTGDDFNCSPNVSDGTTIVRYSGGNVSDNTTGYFMASPGFNPNMGCTTSNRITIFVRSNSTFSVNQTGNGTLVSGTGTGCPASPNCTAIATYSSNINNSSNQF